jgi:hypothetical protein
LASRANEEVIGASGEIGACNGNPDPVTERVGFGAGEVDGEMIFILNDNVPAFQVKRRIKDVVGDLPAAEEARERHRVSGLQGFCQLLGYTLGEDRAERAALSWVRIGWVMGSRSFLSASP